MYPIKFHTIFLSTVPKEEMEASKIEVSQSTFLWEVCIVTYTQHIHIEKSRVRSKDFPSFVNYSFFS